MTIWLHILINFCYQGCTKNCIRKCCYIFFVLETKSWEYYMQLSFKSETRILHLNVLEDLANFKKIMCNVWVDKPIIYGFVAIQTFFFVSENSLAQFWCRKSVTTSSCIHYIFYWSQQAQQLITQHKLHLTDLDRHPEVRINMI